MLHRLLLLAPLLVAGCAATGAPTRLTQASVEPQGDAWIVAGRVHGDTAAHASARELVVEICDAEGRPLASVRTRAALARPTSPRVARGWDGSFRAVVPARAGIDPAAARVRIAGRS